MPVRMKGKIIKGNSRVNQEWNTRSWKGGMKGRIGLGG